MVAALSTNRPEPKENIVMVRVAAKTRVWCDRGRVKLPRSRRGFFADAAAGEGGPTMRGPMGAQMTEMDEHRSREDRVLAKLRQGMNEESARKPPEPAMWPVIVIGSTAGAAMLAAGSVIGMFL
jgi:hypothetical protein